MPPAAARGSLSPAALGLAVAAALFVGGLAWRAVVPSEDGVSYLWMAQAFAAGRWHEGLGPVFPPGWPLVLTPWVALGVPAWTAAAWGGACCFGLAVLPIHRSAERLGAGAGPVAALLFVASPLLPRVAAEAYSEPLFLLCMAWGTWWGLGARWWLVGVAAGLAFWVRPEGLLLAASFVLVDRRAWQALVPAAGGVAALALVRWLAGHGFDPLPILAFHEQRHDLTGRGDVLRNLVDVPVAWLEAFGLGGLLLLLAMRRQAPRAGKERTTALWWQVALQVLVVCTFVVRRRFLLSCAGAVAALGGVVAGGLPPTWRRFVVAGAAAFGVVAAATSGFDADRAVEAELGAHLAALLAPGEHVTGDLTRVLWFAGEPPLPPRHFDAAQLQAFANGPGVRFVVLSTGSKRASSRDAAAALRGDGAFVPCDLPPALRDACEARGITVLTRR